METISITIKWTLLKYLHDKVDECQKFPLRCEEILILTNRRSSKTGFSKIKFYIIIGEETDYSLNRLCTKIL